MIIRIIIVLALICYAVSGATYYVRTDGNNSNNGLANTAGGAWLTIAHANGTVAAGDIVRVQAGTYNEQPSLTKSGSAGRFINYVADGTVVCRGFSISACSYVRVTGFEITHTTTTFSNGIILVSNCNHIEIVDNYIHEIKGSATKCDNSGNNYIAIRGNTIYFMDFISGVYTNLDADGINGDLAGGKWLVEYNTVQRCADYFIHVMGTNDIARNNFCHDFKNSYWNGDSSVHSDIFQDGSDGIQLFCRYHVYERNYMGDCIEVNSHVGIWQDVTGHGDTNNLIRGNVSYNFGSGGVGAKNTSDKFVAYDNSFYNITGPVYIAYGSGGPAPVNPMCANTIVHTCAVSTSPGSIDNESGTGQKIANMGFSTWSDPTFVSTSDPLFTSISSTNFHLQSGSPARGLGTNLLWVTSSANSGFSFTVSDPQLIIDGWGMVDGDTITVGTNAPTVVTNINWGTSTVSVNSSVTWTNLMPIYWGANSAHDLGAFPFGSQDLTNATMVKNGTTYTVTPGGDTREVWFYVDGIPTTNITSAPFSTTISSGTVTAKAYALYAQANPVVTASLTSSTASFNFNNATLQLNGATMQISQ